MTDSKGEKILLLARDDVKGVVFERLTNEGFVIGAISSDAEGRIRGGDRGSGERRARFRSAHARERRCGACRGLRWIRRW